MPWPTNSRTTEYPCASTCCWTAWPMSETRPPTRTAAMPRASASWVTDQQPLGLGCDPPDRQR